MESDTPQTTAWQPIETAPKDGTKILVFLGQLHDGYEDRIEITEWFETTSWVYEPVEGTEDLYRKVKSDLSYAGWNGNGHKATHWMPLPETPEDVHVR